MPRMSKRPVPTWRVRVLVHDPGFALDPSQHRTQYQPRGGASQPHPHAGPEAYLDRAARRFALRVASRYVEKRDIRFARLPLG